MKTQAQLLAFSAALALSLTLPLQAQSDAVLTNGLVAYYAFNGDFSDASGNGLHGTGGSALFVLDRFGFDNSAVAFSGTATSFVQVNTTNFNFADDFSLSVWAKYFASSSTGGPRIFSTAGYEITVDNLGSSNTYANFTAADGVAKTTNLLAGNTWMHIVGTKAGSQLSIYIDGNLAGSGTMTPPTEYSRGFIPKIGGNSGLTYTDNFGGVVDSLRIYNRALSAQDVTDLYAVESTVPDGNKLRIFPAVELVLLTATNQNYQIQISGDLTNWTNFGPPIIGDGGLFQQLFSTRGTNKTFYRVQ